MTEPESAPGLPAPGIGGALHGSMGLGMGLVAAPLLGLTDPELIPGPMLCAGLILALMITVPDRSSADFRRAKWLLVGRT